MITNIFLTQTMSPSSSTSSARAHRARAPQRDREELRRTDVDADGSRQLMLNEVPLPPLSPLVSSKGRIREKDLVAENTRRYHSRSPIVAKGKKISDDDDNNIDKHQYQHHHHQRSHHSHHQNHPGQRRLSSKSWLSGVSYDNKKLALSDHSRSHGSMASEITEFISNKSSGGKFNGRMASILNDLRRERDDYHNEIESTPPSPTSTSSFYEVGVFEVDDHREDHRNNSMAQTNDSNTFRIQGESSSSSTVLSLAQNHLPSGNVIQSSSSISASSSKDAEGIVITPRGSHRKQRNGYPRSPSEYSGGPIMAPAKKYSLSIDVASSKHRSRSTQRSRSESPPKKRRGSTSLSGRKNRSIHLSSTNKHSSRSSRKDICPSPSSVSLPKTPPRRVKSPGTSPASTSGPKRPSNQFRSPRKERGSSPSSLSRPRTPSSQRVMYHKTERFSPPPSTSHPRTSTGHSSPSSASSRTKEPIKNVPFPGSPPLTSGTTSTTRNRPQRDFIDSIDWRLMSPRIHEQQQQQQQQQKATSNRLDELLDHLSSRHKGQNYPKQQYQRYHQPTEPSSVNDNGGRTRVAPAADDDGMLTLVRKWSRERVAYNHGHEFQESFGSSRGSRSLHNAKLLASLHDDRKNNEYMIQAKQRNEIRRHSFESLQQVAKRKLYSITTFPS